MSVILGIDPGLMHTGWGIIKSQGSSLSYIGSGVISTSPSLTLPLRLGALHSGLKAVIESFQPDEAAVEETFVNMNGASTLKLGQARGAILLTLSLHRLPVQEYATNLIKKSLTGNGHADKKQVAGMVKMLLPACPDTKEDATDALAAAIAHAHCGSFNKHTLAALQ